MDIDPAFAAEDATVICGTRLSTMRWETSCA